MNKKRTYVANWKMQFSYLQTKEFCMRHMPALDALSAQSDADIILCPSFVSLPTVIEQCTSTSIAVGAQNCAAHAHGPYTGQVSAHSLQELGCTYCIVGHSEARTYLHETHADIALKVKQLLTCTIIPIICIGEDAQQHSQGATRDVLAHQLAPIITQLHAHPHAAYSITYEPIWAIGTGRTPDITSLTSIGHWIKAQFTQHKLPPPRALLYGGSVTADTAGQLKTVDPFDGFLIGGASLDFQTFEKIVS